MFTAAYNGDTPNNQLPPQGAPAFLRVSSSIPANAKLRPRILTRKNVIHCSNTYICAMVLSATLIIVLITVAVSVWGFSNQKVIEDCIFYGPAISQRRQYYRFITHGLIHADVMHLAFNMLAFYSFGAYLEKVFFANAAIFGSGATFYFAALYISGLIIASLPDYFKHRNDYHFRSLGASGAVAAVIFACIVLYPTMPISIMFLPFGIPGWIFGLLYIGISAYLDKQGGGRINHGAHLWGAIFGVAFTVFFVSLKGDINVFQNFIQQITNGSR